MRDDAPEVIKEERKEGACGGGGGSMPDWSRKSSCKA